MRVAFVMPGVGVVRRGAEAFVVELCQGLGALPGFEVHLFCRGPAPVPHTLIHALPRDQPLIGALYRATRLGRKALDSLFLDPLSLEWATAALSALPHLWRGGFDVVVMEGGLVGAWLCRLLRRRRGMPFVDIAHGMDPKWEGAFARQRPDRVVAFTAAAAEMVRRQAPGAAIVVIPHGIDLERWRRPAREAPSGALPPAGLPPSPHAEPLPGQPGGPPGLPHPQVLCVGAVDALKRMHLAVEAVARLPSGGSLTVLGEGPDAAALDSLAAERLGAGRYLRRVVPREEMPAWYGAADCFTLPSRTESFGLVYLEALACGVPVVAPDDAVRREVIGDAGLLCDVTDAAAYSGALAAALARDWGDLPRRRAERFPIAATVTAYAELLTSLRPAGSVARGRRGSRAAGRAPMPQDHSEASGAGGSADGPAASGQPAAAGARPAGTPRP
jgi:glycosyltransferase involved in cell wall biosynthesis